MSDVEWSGHHPDVIDSLANERVGLAWQRTALSWLAAGLVVVRYFSADGLLHRRTVVGWAMVVVAGILWRDGARRYRAVDRALRTDQPTPVPRGTILMVWIATVTVIFASIAFEVFG
jgi:putative membrane protein